MGGFLKWKVFCENEVTTYNVFEPPSISLFRFQVPFLGQSSWVPRSTRLVYSGASRVGRKAAAPSTVATNYESFFSLLLLLLRLFRRSASSWHGSCTSQVLPSRIRRRRQLWRAKTIQPWIGLTCDLMEVFKVLVEMTGSQRSGNVFIAYYL